MKEKINRIFAAIVKPHWGEYFFSSFIFWLVAFYFHPIPESYKTDFMFFGVCLYVILPSIFIGFWCSKLFYSQEDKQFLDKRFRVGIPATDTYFYTKINSDISVVKKFSGYVYVLLKVVAFGGIGYIMAIAMFVVNKGL